MSKHIIFSDPVRKVVALSESLNKLDDRSSCSHQMSIVDISVSAKALFTCSYDSIYTFHLKYITLGQNCKSKLYAVVCSCSK